MKLLTPRTVLGSAALAAALGTGLALGLSGGSGSTGNGAADLIQRDGYTVIQRISPEQLAKSIAADQSNKEWAGYFGGSAAAGVKGTDEEAVVQLTDSGKATIPALVPLIQAGAGNVTVHVREGYLVVSGPAGSFTDGSAFNWGSK